MPTISQLPTATSVSASDEVPISQAGVARSAAVGALLASAQPIITIDPPSLIGRTSLGSGGPEQIDIGKGLTLADGALAANGQDHATYQLVSSLPIGSDLVISNQGTPMLMQTSLLRGLFSAGPNVAIDTNGVISATADVTIAGAAGSATSAATGGLITSLSSQDLLPVIQTGSNCTITYGNLLNGVTIDEAQAAAAAGDSDTMWVAQDSNIMTSQTFGAIWAWIANKLSTYKAPVVEITANTNLDTTVHNGRLLICSEPVTLTPITTNMGSGFTCTILNASTGNLNLGAGFVSSSGSLVITPWQSATLLCVTYSAGTIAFAVMPTVAVALVLPGQPSSLSASTVSSSTITVSWQPPATGGAASSYIVQYRMTGTTSWTNSPSAVVGTSYQIAGLQPASSYDIDVQAQNAAGVGAASTVLTVTTSPAAQAMLPPQVTGLGASPTASNAIQLSWSPQTGTAAETSFTVQFRQTGSSGWTSSVTGISGTASTVTGLQPSTSYDFEVVGVNTAGSGVPSVTVSAVTLAASQSVSSITWNVLPSGPYTHGSGAIGMNAHVTPAASPVQFGFSASSSTPPEIWTAATLVNTNLWGAYVPVPASAGNWYSWAEGLDGSSPAVSPVPFVVQ